MNPAEADRQRPVVGVSANTLPPEHNRSLYIGKATQYAEEQMLEWIWTHGGIPVVVPVVGHGENEDLVAMRLDGLVLSGGVDIAPRYYGEQPRRPEWAGDPRRDEHEMGLLRAFAARDKPVLGICRGLQLMNVAFGGALHQDALEDGAVDATHRDPEQYDLLTHAMSIARPSYLYELYQRSDVLVNSVHHQAIRDLAPGMEAMAHSSDGLVEAIRHRDYSFVVGVQWHPEWVSPQREADGILSSAPLFEDFIARAADRGHGLEIRE